jgi:hypothetical protein
MTICADNIALANLFQSCGPISVANHSANMSNFTFWVPVVEVHTIRMILCPAIYTRHILKCMHQVTKPLLPIPLGFGSSH